MCGIGAVVKIKGNGLELAKKILIGQENRGASSSGIAWLEGNEIKIIKDTIRPTELVDRINEVNANVILVHSRAPSVGNVSLENSHPFLSCDGSFALVHNGTFSEHEVLKNLLNKQTHNIQGQTDSEIICHFIEEYGKLKTYEEIIKAFTDERLLLLFKDKLIGQGDFYMIQDREGFYVYQNEEAAAQMFGGIEKTVYEISGYFEIDLKTMELKLEGDYTKARKWIRKHPERWYEKDTYTEEINDEEVEFDEETGEEKEKEPKQETIWGRIKRPW
jgi:glutamine phosphoribosylpyrophosphate amidotransferase